MKSDLAGILRSKAMLLLQRERELFELRRHRARTSAWLHAFHWLSAEVRADDAAEMGAEWARLMVRELHFQTVAVYALEANALRLVAGESHSPLRERVPLAPEARAFLAANGSGISNGEPGCEGESIAGAVALERFVWLLLDIFGTRWLLFAGFGPETAPACPPLIEEDLAYFRMLGSHLSMLARSATLIRDLDRERGELRELNDQYAETNRQLETSLKSLRDTRARLALADRMSSIGTLAAGVAHEINNPLHYVISNLEVIAEDVRRVAAVSPGSGLGELAEMVDDARQGAERVRKIVRDLKTFSRVDDELRGPVDVRGVLERSITMVFNEIKCRARLVKDYGEVPAVDADEARLGQVFINLLVNAAHAIPEGQVAKNEIRLVTATDTSGRAVIEVRDTGQGIAPEALDRIFDPFFTTKSIGVGTGLGLSICHGIVSALSGEIIVESAVGKGSVFRVILPPARLEAREDKQRASARAKAERRGRILVVDDEPMVGASLGRALRDHDVTVVKSGREALDQLTSSPRFDVILCDLMMPDVTGMELFTEISRSMPDLAERVVFMTGGAFTPRARAFLDEIPNERFEKPFDLHNLRALVHRLVR